MIGQTLGPYRLLEKLGEGGMGAVYRAQDTRLDRSVAIKVVGEHFGEHFEREARAISALNHPHICTLYDVGPNYLVMELVEGETLADRLKKGPLPATLVVSLGAQIADALSAAHAKQIVHRDLKPANIMLTRTGVKVLDFGVAKRCEAPGGTLTASRMLVGTPAYMAPEQLEGRSCDSRTDIYALGLVLIEMVSGKRPSPGETPATPIAGVSERVSHVIERCLTRDPDDRWQSAADVKHELQWAAKSPPGTGIERRELIRSRRLRVGAAVGALLLLGSGLVWTVLEMRTAPEPSPSLRLLVNLPTEGSASADTNIAGRVGPLGGSEISPNGRLVAFVAYSSGAEKLWVRPLDSLSGRELAGTEGAGLPFWSPDSKSIGFFAGGRLKRVDVSGGVPITLCDVTSGRGGTWNAAGEIVFNGYNDGPLLRVSASGGNPTALTRLDTEHGENSHRFPQFLPDGRRFLFFVRTNSSQTMGVYLGSVDKPSEKVRVLTNSSSSWYAPGAAPEQGYLLWIRNDQLVAQPFDAVTATLSGEPVAIADGPFAGIVGRRFFSASTEGTLLYEKGLPRNVQLSWFGRDGKPQGTLGAPEPYSELKISPDAKRVAVSRLDSSNFVDIWLLDLDRGLPTRLTLNGGSNMTWSPDSQRIAFTRGAPPNIFMMKINEPGREERVTNTRNSQGDLEWSPDAGQILFMESSNEINSRTSYDIWALSLTGERKLSPVVAGPSQERRGRLSPDGRWIAYTSDEAGRNEIYVQRFPSGAAKQRISAAGGDLAIWPRDGKELLYRSGDGTLMSVSVRSEGDSFVFESARPLFRVPPFYDVTPDGQRFLVGTPVGNADTSSLIVVTNWRSQLPDSVRR